jgi:adenine-specific DNA-methyltransferase
VQDETLRERLEQEINKLTKTKKFGLVFEEHIPECTPLYDVPVKRGGSVAKRAGAVNIVYEVSSIKDGIAICVNKVTQEKEQIPMEDLVSVAEFGEPIYPYLKPIDSVCNAPDSDLWHTLIEADNYHALQLLEYLYAGKVDCIYIDPPYNTGAKDWKYNNNYVDGSDEYRHSKWLSMMEKRLKLAKKLLNPEDSVLIVTIDEKEYLHLGCLLEELFPAATIQMITSMTNKKGQPRLGIFSRCEEYIFVIFLGTAKVSRTNDNMLFQEEKNGAESVLKLPTIWNSLLRRGTHSARADRPKLFYPIFIDIEKNKISSVGSPLELGMQRDSVQIPDGCDVAWPIHKDGSEGNWQMKPETLQLAVDAGTAKVGRKDPKSGTWSIVYLKRKQLKQVQTGEIITDGKDENGALILRYPESGESSMPTLLQEPRSLWVRDSHDASVYGSTLIKGILNSHSFAFPKSLYAVLDTLRFFVADKRDALIVDFFAGSGTTLHAVNLLNAEDGGHRKCVLVTNNEVSVDEAKTLSTQGYKPGDSEWEKLGIARYVTWPRTVCSIEGHDVNGKPLKGNYLGSDITMSEGFQSNAIFFKLGFLDKTSVALGRQLAELFPVLWMKAGAHGPCPELADESAVMAILPENRFAILIDERHFAEFEVQLACHPEIDTLYFVTDSDAGYREMISKYQTKETFQLYKDYLDNFRINTRR